MHNIMRISNQSINKRYYYESADSDFQFIKAHKFQTNAYERIDNRWYVNLRFGFLFDFELIVKLFSVYLGITQTNARIV